MSEEPPASGYASQWVSFDAGGGHEELKATVSPKGTTTTMLTSCTPLWKAGEPAESVAGVRSVEWVSSRPGYRMFPALSLVVGSGDFAVYARSC